MRVSMPNFSLIGLQKVIEQWFATNIRTEKKKKKNRVILTEIISIVIVIEIYR